MNKTALGTIIGAALLGLVKSKLGSNNTESIPDYLYHATYGHYVDNIIKQGLVSKQKNKNWDFSESGKIYLAVDPRIARKYAETAHWVRRTRISPDMLDIVIFKIDTKKIDKSLLFKDQNVDDIYVDNPLKKSFEYRGSIPTDAINIHQEGSRARKDEYEEWIDLIQGYRDQSPIENYRKSRKTIRNQPTAQSQLFGHEIRWGRNVGWEVKVEQAIPIDSDLLPYVRSLDGNIFDYKKLKDMFRIVSNARRNDQYVVFEPSYCLIEVIDMSDIKEAFEYAENPDDVSLTTGDDNVDKFLKNEESWISDNMSVLDDIEDIKKFFDEYKQVEPDEFIAWANTELSWEFDGDDLIEDMENWENLQESMQYAKENETGDIGKLDIQLRDGHHRFWGAVSAGEPLIWWHMEGSLADEVQKYLNGMPFSTRQHSENKIKKVAEVIRKRQ